MKGLFQMNSRKGSPRLTNGVFTSHTNFETKTLWFYENKTRTLSPKEARNSIRIQWTIEKSKCFWDIEFNGKIYWETLPQIYFKCNIACWKGKFIDNTLGY